MNNDEIYKKIQETLKQFNQEHLLSQYERLDNENKKLLLNQIKNIDFDLTDELYNNTKKEIKLERDKIEPIEYIEKEKLSKEEKEKYFKMGAEEIKRGKLSVVTMAGGQGTRLRTQRTKRNLHIKCRT